MNGIIKVTLLDSKKVSVFEFDEHNTLYPAANTSAMAYISSLDNFTGFKAEVIRYQADEFGKLDITTSPLLKAGFCTGRVIVKVLVSNEVVGIFETQDNSPESYDATMSEVRALMAELTAAGSRPVVQWEVDSCRGQTAALINTN